MISIHAPLAGCDARRSRGGDTPQISIHAPLAGCDAKSCGFRGKRAFQSTHPSRGATVSSVLLPEPFFPFQSTHPSRGATPAPGRGARLGAISIHAPLAGCDGFLQGFNLPIPFNFNPRTPRGVRPVGGRLVYVPSKFQSTHPSRGATVHGWPCA